MRILKARRGLATNSSSVHSIILAGSGSFTPSVLEDDENLHYNAQLFLLTDRESKLNYFAAYLRTVLMDDMRRSSEDFSEQKYQQDLRTASDIVGSVFKEDRSQRTVYVNAGVAMDAEDERGERNYQFFRELAEAMAQDPTVHVRGGADDDGYDVHSPEYGTPHEAAVSACKGLSYGFYARKSNEVWCLFNRGTGAKLHLDLRSTISESAPAEDYRPEVPELIDLKITDFCDLGCSFCYMGSTTRGEHSSSRTLWPWLQSCKDAGVLELAIGGGEPTLHPEFPEILEEAAKSFYSVAFTTKDSRWLQDERIVKAVKAHVRAIGWSISEKGEVTRVRDLVEKADVDPFYLVRGSVWGSAGEGEPSDNKVRQFSWHFIPGAHTLEDLQAMYQETRAYETLLLLGYKSTGRGGQAPYPESEEAFLRWLFAQISTRHYWGCSQTIAIDTAFAVRQEKVLRELGVPPTLFYKQEGRFSMYYDAVTNRFGPSSYEPKKLISAESTIFKGHPIPARTMFSKIPVAVTV